MRYKEIRQFNFPLHRYLGLATWWCRKVLKGLI